MKSVQTLPNKRWSLVTIDPALNEHRDKIMFPEKSEQANKVLKTAKLPENKNRQQQTVSNINKQHEV